MDAFGSNATPTGGSGGRADAMVGAAEAQKAEGVLHLHLFIYFQMLCQFATLKDIAERLRAELVSADAFKAYVTHVRCAAFPDVDVFRDEQANIEKSWLACATDYSLCRLPHSF